MSIISYQEVSVSRRSTEFHLIVVSFVGVFFAQCIRIQNKMLDFALEPVLVHDLSIVPVFPLPSEHPLTRDIARYVVGFRRPVQTFVSDYRTVFTV